jgi:hypothetical protein
MDQILEHTKTILEDLVFETYRARLIDVKHDQKAYIEHFKYMAYDLYSIYNYQSFSSIMVDIEKGVWNHITLDQVDDLEIVKMIFHPITRALYISKQI